MSLILLLLRLSTHLAAVFSTEHVNTEITVSYQYAPLGSPFIVHSSGNLLPLYFYIADDHCSNQMIELMSSCLSATSQTLFLNRLSYILQPLIRLRFIVKQEVTQIYVCWLVSTVGVIRVLAVRHSTTYAFRHAASLRRCG